MSGIKISDLPAASSALLTDVFPVDQLPGPVTYKESNSQLLTLFQANGQALSATNDTNVTMTLIGSPTTALLNATSMVLGWTGTLSGTRGGTGVNNGASTITLGGSLTTVGAFASTFTMTGVTGVTFPNSGTLATTGGSVPSIQGTANQVLVNGTSGSPVSGSAITLTTPQDIATTSNPIFAGINDTNNLALARFLTFASAVNYLTFSNAATGNAPSISVDGSDSNIIINVTSKGTGSVRLNSAATITPVVIRSGTALQHSTFFSIANTAASRIVTFPDAAFTFVGTAAAMTDGQIPIGNTGNLPTAATLTAGTGVSITNAAGSITIAASGGGLATATIAGTTQTAVVNTKYFALAAGQTTLTLPGTYAVGDVIALIGSTANTGGWIVATAAGDTVRVNNATTSAGGTVTSAAVAGQCIYLECDVANTSWIMTSTVSTTLTTS